MIEHAKTSYEPPFILAVSSGNNQHNALDDFRKALKTFRVNIVDGVEFCSKIPPCFKCGRHTECKIGGAYHWLGPQAQDLKIVPELFQIWENCPETVLDINNAREKLKKGLAN